MTDYQVTKVYQPEDNRSHWFLKLLDRPIAFHRVFVTLTGGVTSALMLSQAWYWSQRTTDPSGWFYKSAKEWQEETGLSVQEQRTARKRLGQFEWWQEEKRKAHGAPTIHYRLNINAFAKHLTEVVEQQQMDMLDATDGNVEINKSMDMLDATNPINIDYTKTTTETTSDGDDGSITWQAVAHMYESEIGLFTPMASEMVQDDFDTYGGEWLIDAIRLAVKAGVRRWNYVQGILRRWHVEGRSDAQLGSNHAHEEVVALEGVDGQF
jgi:DnaD/phage-associated family protein